MYKQSSNSIVVQVMIIYFLIYYRSVDYNNFYDFEVFKTIVGQLFN